MPLSYGNPTSYYGGFGVKKRIQMMSDRVRLHGKTILDAGCGDGQYMEEIGKYTDSLCGVEIESERAAVARAMTAREVISCDLSEMPFVDEFFDIIFCNEVLEHTDDDVTVLKEFRRVLKEDGCLVMYVPNRWYPIETHGAQIWGLSLSKPLFINYLPLVVRNRFCKAARVYTVSSIKRALADSGMELCHVSYIYPAFDKTGKKNLVLAQVMRRITGWLERTPFRKFGISIFLTAQKKDVELGKREVCNGVD